MDQVNESEIYGVSESRFFMTFLTGPPSSGATSLIGRCSLHLLPDNLIQKCMIDNTTENRGLTFQPSYFFQNYLKPPTVSLKLLSVLFVPSKL
jgi:hypothetical protein